jgi:hypothetical protein
MSPLHHETQCLLHRLLQMNNKGRCKRAKGQSVQLLMAQLPTSIPLSVRRLATMGTLHSLLAAQHELHVLVRGPGKHSKWWLSLRTRRGITSNSVNRMFAKNRARC